MSVSYSTWLLYILLILLVFCFIFYSYQTKNFTYWKDQGVPYDKPHWIFGNSSDIIFNRASFDQIGRCLYLRFKQVGFFGFFMSRNPVLYVFNLDLIEKILVQDFTYFSDRVVPDLPFDPFGNSLSNLRGSKWKNLRCKLNPTFSSLKVKGMFHQMLLCCENILSKMETNVLDEQDVEVESLITTYTTEVIASCTFGVQLLNNPSQWRNYLNIFHDITAVPFWKSVKYLIALLYPKTTKLFTSSLEKPSVTDFFVNLTKSAIDYRKKSKRKRNDFLQLMLDMQEHESNQTKNRFEDFSKEDLPLMEGSFQTEEENNPFDKIYMNEKTITSMLFNFVQVGARPTIGTISFTLYELAKNIDIQHRIQNEIDSCIKKHGGLTYEALRDMTYLDQVIQESQRLHTLAPFIARSVTKDYILPNSKVNLKKGMFVFIPLGAIHMDPEYYPSPEKFDPERFTGNNFKSSPVFLPFGLGPRICIAIRFALVIIKTFLAKVLAKYTVQTSNRMREPLQLDKKEFYVKVEGGIWITFHYRNKTTDHRPQFKTF